MGAFLQLFVLGLIASGVGWAAIKLLVFSDTHKVLHKNVPGPCKHVGGVEFGAEDIEVLPNGIAIMSTGLTFMRPVGVAENDVKPGLMKTFDFSKPDEPAKELKVSGFKGRLNPHGISVFTNGGKTYVYVVNHSKFNEPPYAETVEKFLWNVEQGTLVHEKSFSDPEFLGINDLVVVGVDKFYISNFQTMSSGFLRAAEFVLGVYALPLQNVVYFDGTKGTVVLSGLYSANGVSVSTDKKYLFVSEAAKKRISSYRIESPTRLVHVDSKDLGSLPDNNVVDPETGDLWIGCHPKLCDADLVGGKPSPSQVLRVGVKDGKFTSMAEIFLDDGTVLSGSTVAVPYKGSVLIGTVNQKALHCKLVGLNSILKLS